MTQRPPDDTKAGTEAVPKATQEADDIFLAGLNGDSKVMSAAEAEMAEVWDAIGLLSLDDKPVAVARPVLADKRLWLAMAACLVLTVTGALLWSQRSMTYSTPVGGHVTVALADGSHVTLNTASTIQVWMNGHRREVRLQSGEAYFEVAHRGDREPFFVAAGPTRIRVTGTRFAVNLHPDRQVDIDLLEGHIRAGASGDAKVDGREAVALTAGNGLHMDASGHVTARVAAAHYIEAWLQRRAYFDNTPLSDAVAEMNRYRADPLVIADPAKAGARVTGVFDTTNAEGFAKAVKALYGVQVSGDEGADQQSH